MRRDARTERNNLEGDRAALRLRVSHRGIAGVDPPWCDGRRKRFAPFDVIPKPVITGTTRREEYDIA